MYIWYTAQFEIRKTYYGLGHWCDRRACWVQCLMVPGTIDPIRDWEFEP